MRRLTARNGWGILVAGCFGALLALASVSASEMRAASPSKTERCPVCGMFVAGYSNWFAGVQFKDGSHATFDGPKDLFKYLAAMKRYEKKRTDADLVATYVTDYYRVRPVDARKAFYVTKSNVYGPMGEEYVPFENESDAAEFLRDHKGKKVLTFSEALAEVRALEAKP